MKNYIIALLLLFSAIPCFAQTDAEKMCTVDAVSQEARFKLYPTTNNFIFLKLDSKTGKIWLVQYSTTGTQLQAVLSSVSRCLPSEEKNGRFSLYPTKNMYNFIMIDHENGNCWQVQWSIEPENRIVIPITE